MEKKLVITAKKYRGESTVVSMRIPAELLQKLMDKYTFKGVEHSWTKVCYYYDYMGR
jgi:hypothetical protein